MFGLITKIHMHTSGHLEGDVPKAEARLQSYSWVAILSPVHGLGCAVRFGSALHSVQTL